jgi:hypothetical protein
MPSEDKCPFTTFMTKRRWLRYKRSHNTIPHCISCGIELLVGVPIEVCHGSRNRKYLCGVCSLKPIVVYQYPLRKQEKVGKKFWFDKKGEI